MYIPDSEKDKEEILNFLGVASVNDIFYNITGKEEFFDTSPLGEPLSQYELIKLFNKEFSKFPKEYIYLVGGGAYDHFIPPAVDYLLRSEFITSYTPYQPEVSQGVLKAIWDFQSIICNILNQEVCNSSHYDGATAAAEAVVMAKRIYPNKNSNKYIISNTVHPSYIEVMKTYTEPLDINPIFVEFNEQGETDFNKLSELINDDVFGIVIQSPNVWGIIENVDKIREISRDKLVILVVTEPFAYILFNPPKVDIVACSLQSFGIPLLFGGPYLGVIATSMSNIRHIPGRIIGQTVDKDGKEAYTMILQTREQHIRREKATSNICTNQSLMAIRTVIYLYLMGKDNLIKAAKKTYTNTKHFIKKINEELRDIQLKLVFNNENVFNETLLFINDYNNLYSLLKKEGVIFGVSLRKLIITESQKDNFKKIGIADFNNLVLLAFTEKLSKNEIDQVIKKVNDLLKVAKH